MSVEPTGSEVPSRAQQLLLSFLRAQAREPGLELDAWLAASSPEDCSPSVATELRALIALQSQLERALSPPPADHVRGRAPTGASEPGLVHGARIADFVLEARLGAGAMGEVWKATQLSLQRSVALKFMSQSIVSDQRREFFAREARAGGRVAHSGIVAVYGTGEEGALAWIAMELVPGGRTLSDRLRDLRAEGELPPDHHAAVARLMSDLADALQAAHDQGVIHRDLKPSNILLDQSGRPKVSDFGLAKLVDELSISRAGDLAGTYAYMSPEQFSRRTARIDHRTDVFSLGVVLYELLTLTKPFEGETPLEIMRAISLRQPADPRALRSRVPAELSTITLKCLEKEAARRYASMRALKDDLERFLRHEPIVALAPGRVRRAELWVRRNPTASAVVLVVTVGLLVVSWLLARSVQREARLLELGNLRQVRVLIEEADRLWPAVPARIDDYQSWLARAESLVQDLDRHRRTRDELEARARPRTEAAARAESEQHPEHARLVTLRAERDVLQRAEEARRESARVLAPETADPRAAEYEGISDPITLLYVAESLVAPGRPEFGKEALGLALARQALLRLPADQRQEARVAIVWALHALGRDAEAEEEARAALAEVPSPNATFEAGFVEQLAASAARAQGPEGRIEARARIAELESEAARVSALVSARRSWSFDDPRDEWLHEGISAVVREIEAFADPARGSIDGLTPEHGIGVRKRLERARTITRRSLDEPAERWREAALAIADPRVAPPYAGLVLTPQLGLVPLARDPESGLWEFLDVDSGDEPARDEHGRIVPTPEMGVVFVLIPGGTAVVGVQNADPNAPRYDPGAPQNQVCVQRVELDPFFLSKYEMTQAQWERLTGVNPSLHLPGSMQGDKMVSAIHPVEQVSWHACAQVLERQGWRLPTEAQWEYATRAGTDTRWWTGDDPHSLAGAANLSDASVCRHYPNDPSQGCEGWLDDGWLFHSPVGMFRPNGFGLFDVIGNLAEWCRDGRIRRWRPLRRGDGEIEAPDGPVRMVRGGCCIGCAVWQSASWFFFNFPPATSNASICVRPARVVQR